MKQADPNGSDSLKSLGLEPPLESQPSDKFRIDRWIDTVLGLWERESLRPRLFRICFWTLIVAVCAARAYIGLTGTRIYSHDAFAILDPAWRILNGQIPHADFFDNLGPAAYLPTALGLLLAGGNAEGFGYGQAICALGLACWAYLLGRNRLSDSACVLMGIVVVLTAAAPFALGDACYQMSPGMTYNRYGYAFVGILLTEAMKPGKSRTGEYAGGFSTGSILMILLFLKVTFFVGAIALLGALAVCRPQSRIRWVGILSGACLFGLLFIAYLRFDLLPMWRDLVLLAGAKHLRPGDYRVVSIAESAGLLVLFSVTTVLFLYMQRQNKIAVLAFVSGIGGSIAGLLFIFSSYEKGGFPLQAIIPILLLDLTNRKAFPVSEAAKAFHVSLLLWGGYLIAMEQAPNAFSLLHGIAQKIHIQGRYETIHSPILRSFLPIKEDEYYRVLVNDGIALLDKSRRPGDSVMSLDFTNPFSYGLGMKPAFGGAIALQYGTTFNDSYRLSGEWLFGHATLVMVPKRYSDETLIESIPRLYGPYLAEHFTLISESPRWYLYRNRNACIEGQRC